MAKVVPFPQELGDSALHWSGRRGGQASSEVGELDGGRMLRAALWGWRNDVIWATWVAAGAGNIFGILLIVLGLIDVLRGDFVGGMWLALIGLFLRGGASATYEQTLARISHTG
jgi:hypothetical protein